MRRARFSPIVTQVKCRLARPSLGMIEASELSRQSEHLTAEVRRFLATVRAA
jgi:hypothetical protein